MTDQVTGANERHEDLGAVGSPVQRPVRPTTPGPWRAVGTKMGSDFGILDVDGRYVIAECFSDIRREGESALAEAGANATMMAASWRLYWEAKLYVQTVDPSGQWAQLQGLREAIAAAELRA